jgi:SulP family sulfate permease
MFSAFIKMTKTKITLADIQVNVLAGLTVGVIALPLSMGLAIASGVAPQHGLYTAIIAGIIIALTGGSKVNISGPTAAFVVILLPIVQQFGLGGLLMSGFLAGIILVLLGLARLGRLIQIVPYPVTIGFTAGIGVVIAILQIKDLLGLDIISLDGEFSEKIISIVTALPTLNWQESSIGLITLAILVFWNRLPSKIPSHLVALTLGSLIAWLASLFVTDFSVATIGTRFHYDLNGIIGNGIPPFMPTFAWPWDLPDANGNPIGLSLSLFRSLFGAAIAIAILGALESLLCAVVADGLSGKKHNPDDELIGQGIGNMIVPFFGGLPATAAIARTAANVRAGGTLPLASIVHAIFILLAILTLAPLLAYIPMASMAALLLMVAWHMSEYKHFMRIIKVAPTSDKLTLLTCFSLTVLIDMEVAVAVGMSLAAVLFIKRSIELSGIRLSEPDDTEHQRSNELPAEVVIYDIDGPMFFGSAQKALSTLTEIQQIKIVILNMSDVTMLDMTAMVAMESVFENFKHRNILLIINGLNARMLVKLRKVGISKETGLLHYTNTLDEAITLSKKELYLR